MAVEPPVCDFGLAAPDFSLPGVDGKTWALSDCRGENGTLVVFMCNHCPYVQAIRTRLVRDASELENFGVRTVAISANDPITYPDDSFENMIRVARDWALPFPYLFDESQAVAKAYGAVCTPDFFGYDKELGLQYRGRLDESRRDTAPDGVHRDLFEAMKRVAQTGHGPQEQIASIGCSIKWRE